MKGDPAIIKQLNQVLTLELTAINQYFLHSRMMEDWGYKRLAKSIYSESIRQMKAAEKLTDRILFLEGLPNYQKLLKLSIGENAAECLQNDLKFALSGREEYVATVAACIDKKDHASRELIEHLLEKEESYIEWLEEQNRLISAVGVENYLAEQLEE